MADIRITTGGRDRIKPAAALLSKAFAVDPTITYLLSSLSPAQRDAYRPHFFEALMTAAALNNSSIDEADDWKSCGVLVPPGSKIGSLGTLIPSGILSVLWSIGYGGCQRMLRELPQLTKRCKAKCLREGEKYYYVFFLGTDESGRGKGLCSALVRRYQAIAAKERLPIYLEAATEYAWGLYKKLGFVTVDELLNGKGKAAADGTSQAGGLGFKTWAMIWRPDGAV